jgi:hypothetical protein
MSLRERFLEVMNFYTSVRSYFNMDLHWRCTLTANYAEQVGADAYAPDASRAVSAAKSLIA